MSDTEDSYIQMHRLWRRKAADSDLLAMSKIVWVHFTSSAVNHNSKLISMT
jgi:hypothetical protein